jgi:Tfp pilus assembly protein FimT
MTEVLVVVVILSITMMLASSLVTGRVRAAKIRVAANQLETDLRAARLSAVANRTVVHVVVSADPLNSYAYTDARGDHHQIQLPSRVRIVSSTSPISFLPNGSVLGGATTVIETAISSGEVERWNVDTSPLGISRAARVVP